MDSGTPLHTLLFVLLVMVKGILGAMKTNMTRTKPVTSAVEVDTLGC
jgi:hypothetical protein